MAVERLDRFNRETRLYRDPNAEVVIPGFGYGSPNAVRLQVQEQVEAARAEYERLRQAAEQTQTRAQAQAKSPVVVGSAASAPQPLAIGEETARQIADLERRQRIYNAAPARRPCAACSAAGALSRGLAAPSPSLQRAQKRPPHMPQCLCAGAGGAPPRPR